MAARGVHFALSESERTQIDQCREMSRRDASRKSIELIEEIEERWDREWLCETDKAWDCIHRTLTSVLPDDIQDSVSPLQWCIWDAEQLTEDDAEYFISFVSDERVATVSEELSKVDRRTFADQLKRAVPEEAGEVDYFWDHFFALVRFYQKAARDGRSVLFSVDQ